MKVQVFVGKALFRFAKHLPLSDSKISFGSKRLRAFCGRLMLNHCGKNVNIERGAQISSDVSLGDNSGIGVNAVIGSGVVIGNDVMMGPDCMLYTTNHGMKDTSIPMWRQPSSPIRPVVIEDDVWLGARVIVLPGVRIGTGSVIGAGSVVTHDIAPYSIAAGNPARVIRSRLTEEQN